MLCMTRDLMPGIVFGKGGRNPLDEKPVLRSNRQLLHIGSWNVDSDARIARVSTKTERKGC